MHTIGQRQKLTNPDATLLKLAATVRHTYELPSPEGRYARTLRRLTVGRAVRIIRDTYPVNFKPVYGEFRQHAGLPEGLFEPAS